MSVPERMVVSATVESRAEEKDGFRLELEVPQFRSRYPIKVSRVPEAIAKILPPRDTPYMVVLLRENLQKDKTGELPWHYYWGLEGLASPQDQAAQAEQPDPIAVSADEREHRIMRSTALAQAVATSLTYTGAISELPSHVGKVLAIATQFYAWLRDGPQDAPAQAPTATHSPAKAADRAQGQKGAARPPASVVASGTQVSDYEGRLQAFFAKALADLGMNVEAVNAVAKREGVDLNNVTTDLRLLWDKLKTTRVTP